MSASRAVRACGLAVGLAAVLALAACETTESTSSEPAGEQVRLEKGMAAADLIAAIGEPDEIREADPPVDGMEVWVYRKQGASVRLAVTGTKETPHFDPITGVYMPIIDPVYNPETTSVYEETHFLMADGKMVAWKVKRSEGRVYSP